MAKELNRDVRNKIIDLIYQQSIDFNESLSEINSLFSSAKYTSFDEFREEFNNFGKFSYWIIEQISIYSENIKSLIKEYDVLTELYEVSCFVENNCNAIKVLLSNLNHDFSRYLFSLKYITSKIKEKQKINEEIFLLFEPVLLFNSYKYYNFDVISKESKESLLDVFSNTASFTVLKDNFEKTFHPCRDEYLNAIESIELTNYLDWNHSIVQSVIYEEQLLTELLSVKYNHETDLLQEMMNFGSPWPDYKRWDVSEIEELKKYFNNKKVDLIIELILNILTNKPISLESENELLKIVETALCNITYVVKPIVYFAFKKRKNFSVTTQNQLVKISISKTETLSDIHIIDELKENGVILHNNCILMSNTKNKAIIKNALEANNCKEFLEALSNITAFKYGTNNDLKQISKQFQRFEAENRPDLYIAYMKILNYLKSNIKFDISWINEEIVWLIYYWRNHGYKLSMNLVKKHVFPGSTISKEKIVRIQDNYLSDPRLAFFGFSNEFNDNNLLDKIKTTSEQSMSLFVDKLYLSTDFPKYKKSIVFDKKRTDIENVLFPFFEDFVSKNRHHLLNSFPTIVFIKDIVDKCEYATLCWGVLYEIRSKILSFIKKSRPKSSLGPYHKKTTYADLTMLFPLLEREVLYTGSTFGFPPLITENNDKFGTQNSPAEMLLKLIKKIYNETDSLYLASDFIWIYLLMYCRDGLNIRNNVIHGNNYPFASEIIDHYYTITLICLADLIKRNDNFGKRYVW